MLPGDRHRRHAHGYKSGITFDQALVFLTSPGRVEKNPKVWVRSRNEFVPVGDLDAVA